MYGIKLFKYIFSFYQACCIFYFSKVIIQNKKNELFSFVSL